MLRESTPQQTVVTVPECIFYGLECPTCGEWHEHDSSKVGKQIECICGTLIKVRAHDAA